MSAKRESMNERPSPKRGGFDVQKIAIIALLITIVLLLSIFVIARSLSNERKDIVSGEIQRTYNSLNEMQMFILMSETYGDQMACIAFTNKLQNLDTTVWNLGIKLDQYRSATEEFRKDEFYHDQKQVFNEQEFLYMMLLTKLRSECNYSKVIVSFFYKNSEECKKCDDQSFVLTDINRDQENDLQKPISIFSYDDDLNLTSVSLLMKYYKIEPYMLPCTVVNDVPYCGIQDKEFLMKKICIEMPDVRECADFAAKQKIAAEVNASNATNVSG